MAKWLSVRLRTKWFLGSSPVAVTRIHVVKKDICLQKNKSLSVEDKVHEIKREVQAIKMKILHSKNKLNVIKKNTNTYIDESEKGKKTRIKFKKYSERINMLRAKSNKPLKKSNNSTKALKFYRSEDENKKLRDENKKLRDENKKLKDEIKRLVDTSKASVKTVNTDKKIIEN